MLIFALIVGLALILWCGGVAVHIGYVRGYDQGVSDARYRAAVSGEQAQP